MLMSRVFGGYVYVLTNECMPGIVKIGKTNREGDDRFKELYTTGVPTPFDLAYQIHTLDMALLEFAAHKEFDEHRLNKSREFFRVETSEVKRFLEDLNRRIALDIFERFLPDCVIVEKRSSDHDEEAALEARLAEIRAKKARAA